MKLEVVTRKYQESREMEKPVEICPSNGNFIAILEENKPNLGL